MAKRCLIGDHFLTQADETEGLSICSYHRADAPDRVYSATARAYCGYFHRGIPIPRGIEFEDPFLIREAEEIAQGLEPGALLAQIPDPVPVESAGYDFGMEYDG